MPSDRPVIHPGAWWIWALGAAVAVTRTTNPLLLALMIAVAVSVVVVRGRIADLRLYLWLGALIITIRLVFRLFLGADPTGTVLFTLPHLDLPEWATGVTIGGAISAESLLAAFTDGLRLAAMVIAFGAANALTDVRRLLAMVPGALYEAGTAVTIGLTIAPRLVETTRRVTRAQELRGIPHQGPARIRRILVPVLASSLDGSITLAASMDSRGYGRVGGVDPTTRFLSATTLLGGLIGILIGSYGLLDTTSGLPGPVLLGGGIVLAIAGLRLGGKAVTRTRYRPDPWGSTSSAVAVAGITAAVLLAVGAVWDPSGFHPTPGSWPILPLTGVLAVAIAGLAAMIPGGDR